MALFRLRLNNGTLIEISVVESMSFGGEQSVIVYESPGSDGGTTITTGRKNKAVVLSGKLLGQDALDVNTKKLAIERVRDAGEPINLDSPIDSEDTGRYIISSFNGSLPQGTQRYITFELTLTEYRQANIKQSSISLVNFQPLQLLTQRARDRNILA